MSSRPHRSTDSIQVGIQRQIDQAAAKGGGTVILPEGEILLTDALHLRCNVHLRGSARTILRRVPSVASRLVDRVGYGHYEMSVEEPDLFPVGCGVHVFDQLSYGFYTTVASVTGRKGNLIFIDRPFAHDYGPKHDAIAVRIASIIESTDVHDASITDMVLDGNVDETRNHDGCRAAGVYLLRSHRIRISGVEVMNYRGDAVSFQACTDVVVRGCRLHHNSGNAIHPGSGSVRYVIADNGIHDNGGHGIFYCLRSTHSNCRGNRIERNGECGISVGERDSHHLIRDNVITDNGGAGIEFRTFIHQGGNCLRMEDNRIGPNCRKTGDHEVDVAGGHHDLHFIGNDLSPAVGKKTVQIGAGCSAIVFQGNRIGDHPLTAADVDATGSSISFGTIREPLAVGPAMLERDGALHLNIELLPPWDQLAKELGE
ncbi:MAG: right-handed parallel beta-helix repeat-containing protein [Phycisphaerales bacterium]|jgi:hypothetical protein|nr:right-handed parallel beta-helix repeat-containing protein [Phycisphaerales bacterium]